MRILQICIKPPFPPVDGGTLAMNSITQGLLDNDCHVRVLSICSDKHPVREKLLPEEYKEQTHFEAVHVDLNIHPIEAAVAMLCGESYHVKRYKDNNLEHKIIAVLSEEEFDIVHLESVFLTPYVPTIRKHSNARIVLRAHNVEHHIWQQVAKSTRNPLKRWYLKHAALALKAYEIEHLNDYDCIVSITESDAEAFRKAGCRKKVCSIPFGVKPEPMEHVDVEPFSLFHIGSMDWMPNLDSIEWLLNDIWPAIHREAPEAHLYLAGRKMPPHLLNCKLDGVSVTGEVPDAMYFIASKQINIVPLRSGSGIRVKIIEAMSAGKTVISTSIGAQGIDYTDGKDILIANTPEDFAKQVKHCVEDPEFCLQVGRNAYQLIVEHYDNMKLTEKLLNTYQSILD